MISRPGRERVWTENNEETRSVFWREGDRTILQVPSPHMQTHIHTTVHPHLFFFLRAPHQHTQTPTPAPLPLLHVH